MNQCSVCGSTNAHEERVSEIFHIEGKPVLVENIPARMCDGCGGLTLNRKTTEKIRRMLHGEAKPVRTMHLDVFANV